MSDVAPPGEVRSMIQRASFHNFKCLRKVENLTFAPLTVLVGPNGCGKTTVLRAIHLLSWLGMTHANDILLQRNDPLQFLSRGANLPFSLEIAGCWGGVDGALSLTLSSIGQFMSDEKPPLRCKVEVNATWGATKALIRDDLEHLATRFPALAQRMAETVKLNLEFRALAEPSYTPGRDPFLWYNGAFLASVIVHMAGSMPDEFKLLQEAACKVIPGLKRIGFREARVDRTEPVTVSVDGKTVVTEVKKEYWGHELVVDFDGAPGVRGLEASEGTLLVIGLLTAIMGPAKPKLILLDDLDRALHPRAQEELVCRLRDRLAKDDELQVIATSHSPYILDHFAAEEVRIMYEAAPTDVRVAKLTDHPEFKRWKDVMKPGEFWSSVGEKWLAEQSSVHAQ